LLNLLFAQTGDAAANSDLAERCSASRSIKCKQNSKYSAFPPETNGHQASRSVSMNTSRVAKQPPQRKQKKKFGCFGRKGQLLRRLSLACS